MWYVIQNVSNFVWVRNWYGGILLNNISQKKITLWINTKNILNLIIKLLVEYNVQLFLNIKIITIIQILVIV